MVQNYTFPVEGANVIASIPDLTDDADIVKAFQDYHQDIAVAIVAKANIASPTFTGTVVLPDSTVTNAMLAGSIANSKLANTSITITGTAVPLGSSITTLKGGIYGATSTTYTSATRIFIGPTAPDAAAYSPQVGDIWMW
jgi:hypothetical protein